MAVSKMNDMGHDCVVSEEQQRNQGVYAYHEGSDTKLEYERVNGVIDLLVELVSYKQINSKSTNTGPYSSLTALEQNGNVMDKSRRQTTKSDRSMQCSTSHEI